MMQQLLSRLAYRWVLTCFACGAPGGQCPAHRLGGVRVLCRQRWMPRVVAARIDPRPGLDGRRGWTES